MRVQSTIIDFQLRRDIQWSDCVDERNSERSWIAEDPLSRRLFRCGHQERQILDWFRSEKTLEQIVVRFNREFYPAQILLSDVQSLISRCWNAGLLQKCTLNSVPSNRHIEYFPRVSRSSKIACKISNKLNQSKNRENAVLLQTLIQWISTTLSKWLQSQIPLVNPDRWLDRMAPYSGFLYSRNAIFGWLFLCLVASILVGFRFDQFLTELPRWDLLRSPASLIGFGFTFFLTRFVHEFGHAAVCKRVGASCRELGVLVSFGMACPYVDITDAWRSKRPLARMAVAMAGIYSEVIVASCAAILWLATYPGWLHTCALQTMLVCSITTVLFNANPLMKYDGYYVLCDWLNIQNLRERSFQVLDDLLGGNRSRQRLSLTFGLLVYFFASTLNRVVVAVAMAGMVYAIACQWELAGLGIGLILFYCACFAFVSFATWSLKPVQSRPLGTRATVLGWIAVSLLVAWTLNVPLPNRVHSIGRMQMGIRSPVYCEVSGRIVDFIDSKSGTHVKESEVLVRLANDSIERAVDELEIKLSRVDTQLATAERIAFRDSGSDASLPLLRTQRELVRQQLEQRKREAGRLQITSPSNGRFEPATAPPPSVPENPSDSAFGLVSYQADSAFRNWERKSSLGRYVESGTLLGWVVEEGGLSIESDLAEEQLDGLHVGSNVRVRVGQDMSRVWDGAVVAIAAAGQQRAGTTVNEVANSTVRTETQKDMMYRVRVNLVAEHSAELNRNDFLAGSADVVFFRPSESILRRATTFVLRNFRIR